MCTESHLAAAHGVSADKLLDMLHRLMATLEVGQGHVEVRNILFYLLISLLFFLFSIFSFGKLMKITMKLDGKISPLFMEGD